MLQLVDWSSCLHFIFNCVADYSMHGRFCWVLIAISCSFQIPRVLFPSSLSLFSCCVSYRGLLERIMRSRLFGFTVFYSIKYHDLILFFSLGNFVHQIMSKIFMIDQEMIASVPQCENCFFPRAELFVYVVCMDNCPLLCAPASALTVITHPSFSLFPNCSFSASVLSLSLPFVWLVQISLCTSGSRTAAVGAAVEFWVTPSPSTTHWAQKLLL